MNRNILAWLVYSLFVGLLLYGGVYRTTSKNLLGSNSMNSSKDTLENTTVNQLTVKAVVNEINSESVIMEVIDYNNSSVDKVLLNRRALRYALSQGFSANIGDQLEITGFMENNNFELISMHNLNSGKMTTLRDASGHPLWSGTSEH